tara:strand:- start:241 stop:1551 length:1311 start_codon:yes stop_codon:yes gene_type:complete
MTLSLCTTHASYDIQTAQTIRYGLPIFSAFIATIFGLFFTFTDKKNIHQKIEVFLDGAANPTILYMYFIFIFSTTLSHILDLSGGLNSAINVGLSYMPTTYMLPSMFMLTSVFSFATGTSLGSIAALMPIAHGIAISLHINPALMAAVVVSGSMFGDNLSVISDTTIAATRSTNSKMTAKFKENIYIATPAFLITLGLLFYMSDSTLDPTILTANIHLTQIDYINVLPYALVLLLAFAGVEVLAVLGAGALLGATIGIILGKFSFLHATSFIFEGFYGQKSMVRIVILLMFISGLSKIIEHNGGFSYLLNKMSKKATNGCQAQLLIAFLTIIINITIAINTLSILLTGPIAKQLADKFNIPGGRVACLLDVAATSTQGFLPYAPMMILASTLSNTPVFSIMKYLTYQPLLFISMICSIMFSKFCNLECIDKKEASQ